MPIKIIADDARLGNRTPVSLPSCISLHVDGATPLEYFLNRVRSLAEIHGSISSLYLIGQAVDQVFTGEADGGEGMVFCREQISVQTVARLALLEGLVDHIILIICAPLPTPFDVYVDEAGRRFDLNDAELMEGDELARQMAIHTRTTVISLREPRHRALVSYAPPFAGYELQTEGDLLDFSGWDGIVTRYEPEGKLATVMNYVPGWKDDFGSHKDPRSEL